MPPSVPEVVEFRSDEVLSTNITLTWRVPANTGHPGIISYRITAVGGASPVVYNSPDNETAQTIPGLLPGVSYNLTVQAVSGYGSVTAVSDPSEPVMATTQFTGEQGLSYLSPSYSLLLEHTCREAVHTDS